MMRRPCRHILLAGIATLACFGSASAGTDFARVEAQDFAKQDFVFPDDIRGDGLHLVFLGVARDQENGEAQGESLLEWHAELTAAGVIPADATAWHFPVMESPPFFVKGLIRRGIAKNYVDVLPAEQGAVLFVDDVGEFAGAAGIELDGRPTVVVYSLSGGILEVFRGEPSPAGVTDVAAAVRRKR